MLDKHNEARIKRGLPPIAWNDDLAADAEKWSTLLAATHVFKHSTEPRGRIAEGENLFMGTRAAFRCDEMIQLWVDEARVYKSGIFPNVSDTGSWHDVGHFTQIIWRGTIAVGCAISSDEASDYLVCRYSPPGNVVGQRVEQ